MDPRTTLRYRIRVQRDERPSISPRYNPQGSRTGPGAKSDIYDSLVSEGWRQVRYAVHGGLRDAGAPAREIELTQHHQGQAQSRT